MKCINIKKRREGNTVYGREGRKRSELPKRKDAERKTERGNERLKGTEKWEIEKGRD